VLSRKRHLFLVTGIVGALLGLTWFCLRLFRYVEQVPARPMFHNVYGLHPEGLARAWQPEIPVTDKQHNELWADYSDNVLLFVERPPTKNGPIATRWKPGLTESRFEVVAGREILINKCENRLIIGAPTGEVNSFPLGPGQAEQFFVEMRRQQPQDLKSAVNELKERKSGRTENGASLGE
jgi:hypothetical protein